MKKFKLLFLILWIISCSKPQVSNLDDCGTAYSFDDPKKIMDQQLVAKVRYVVFLDTIDTLNAEYINQSLAALNGGLDKETFKDRLDLKFELDEIITICSKDKKEDMPSFIKHAFEYNKEGVFNIYIYGDNQPYMTGELQSVRGRAAGILSRSIAVRHAYISSSTIIHEMLHCLGLIHVHQNDPTDGFNTEKGDLVCDTQAINIEEYTTGDCNYIGPHMEGDIPEKYTCNIMTYVKAECRNCLTDGQIDRVRAKIFDTSFLRECFGLPVSEI